MQGRCPKCNGNLFLDYDSYGWYRQCLQCALILDCDPVEEAELRRRMKAAAELETAVPQHRRK